MGMLASPCAWKGSNSEVGARNTECGERMTARSMKFCNSRTFPGHGYRTNAIHGLRRDFVDSLVHSPGIELGEMPNQFRNVFSTLPQRRNVDRKYFQSVIQVLAKCRLLYHAGQIAMRSGDQPHIHFMSAVAAEPLKFLLLQNAQQFRLKFERDVADFVQKERALVRQFKASHFLRDRSGKCSFFVTEQLTLQKPERNRGAIQFNEGAFAAGAQIVYRAGNQLLAGSGLAQDQHARIRRRNNGYQLQRGLQSGALPHDCPTLSANFLFQVESLFRFFISILYRLFVLQRVLNCNRYLAGHLLEQDDVVFLESIVRTPAEHQNPNHAACGLRAEDNSRL